MDTNNFVFDEDCDFQFFTKLERTIENNFSFLMVVIWNYVSYGIISYYNNKISS